jgi:hypothetical protein
MMWVMQLGMFIDRQTLQMTVAYTALGGHVIGKVLDLAHLPLEHGDLQTVIVIDVHMQRCDRQVVVVMLG